MTELKVSIEYSDWYKDAKENDIVIKNKEDLINLLGEKHTARNVGEWLFALIQTEEAPPELLPDAKQLLSDGTMYRVHLAVRYRRELMEVQNQKNKLLNVRTINHPGRPIVTGYDAEDGAEKGEYAGLDSDLYLENALARLHETQLPGAFRNTIYEIAVKGGDYREAAETFFEICHAILDELDEKLANGDEPESS